MRVLGYKSTFIDIFSDNVVYTHRSINEMRQTEPVRAGEFGCTKDGHIKLMPLEFVEKKY